MRKCSMGLLVLLSVLLPTMALAGVEGFARLSLVQGEVQIRDEESGEWLPAGANTPLLEGDSVWAPVGSRAEIQLRNGTYLRLEGRTILDLVDIDMDQQRVHVESGRLYVKTGGRADELQVDWGDASVLVDRKSRLKVDLLANGDEEIAILKGNAYVESASERTRVRAGESITIHDHRDADITPLRPADEWERWNNRRDKQIAAARRSGGNLPEELVIYEDDLARNGEWIVVAEYGSVWRPRIGIDVDWAPYRHGRWVWRGQDYVWIAKEPWGWAPYHYGRWLMVPGRGWCWVPPARGDVYWGPGYVGWVSTGSQVGWVPLAPRETYYGRGHFGRHSVNISQGPRSVNITNITYRNVTVNNAVTVVSRDGFARGTGRHEAARQDLFRQRNIFVPRPEIRPTAREARMPVVRPTATKHAPPAVQRPPVRELRDRYPLLREERRRGGIQQRQDVAPSPAPTGRATRPDQRAPAAAQTTPTPAPPPPVPRRGGTVEQRREQPPAARPEKPQTPPSIQRPEGATQHRAPEQKVPEPRVMTPAATPPPEKGASSEASRGQRRGERQPHGSRRAWQVETKEQGQKQGREETKKEPAPAPPAPTPAPEPRQERRRRGD